MSALQTGCTEPEDLALAVTTIMETYQNLVEKKHMPEGELHANYRRLLYAYIHQTSPRRGNNPQNKAARPRYLRLQLQDSDPFKPMVHRRLVLTCEYYPVQQSIKAVHRHTHVTSGPRQELEMIEPGRSTRCCSVFEKCVRSGLMMVKERG